MVLFNYGYCFSMVHGVFDQYVWGVILETWYFGGSFSKLGILGVPKNLELF